MGFLNGALAMFAAALALLLCAFRLAGRARAIAALRLIRRWRRFDWRAAYGVVAGLAGLSLFLAGDLTLPARDAGVPVQIAGQMAGVTDDGAAQPPATTANTSDDPVIDSAAKERALEKLRAYADKIGTLRQSIASLDSANKNDVNAPSLPDVDTMIERLAKRLETEPNDANGWRTLGWSYLNTGRPADAVKAYERLLTLTPGNSDAETALNEARKKAASPSLPSGDATPAPAPNTSGTDQSQMIRDMVQRLAARLESQPQDEDGWVRLIRARTVLGETELAREALRKGLAAFSNDASARDRILQAAKENGVNAY